MIRLFYSIVQESEISDQQLIQLIDQLPLVEKQRISKLKQKQDRILSTYGLLMLKEVAGNIDSLQRDAYGKPFLEPALNFSISHAGKLVACAYTESGEVGLDVEEIKNIDISDFHLVMTEKEIGETDSSESFFKLWTQKEAVIKGAGKGFSIDVKELELKENTCVCEGKSWFLSQVKIHPAYECYVAHTEKQEIVLKEFVINAAQKPVY